MIFVARVACRKKMKTAQILDRFRGRIWAFGLCRFAIFFDDVGGVRFTTFRRPGVGLAPSQILAERLCQAVAAIAGFGIGFGHDQSRECP
jgi:hypothetical protein